MNAPAHSRLAALCVAMVVLGGGSVVSASDSDPKPQIDAETQKLLNQFVGVYKNMPAYSDHGTVTLIAPINGKDSTESSPMTLTFARPNKFRLCAGRICLISNGENLTSVVDPTRRYIESKAPKTASFTAVRETPIGGSVLSGSTGVAPMILLGLLTSPDPLAEMIDGTREVKIEGTREVNVGPNDKRVEVCMFVDQVTGPDVRLYIDQKTMLLNEVEVRMEPNDLFTKIPAGVKIGQITFRWISGGVRTEPPAADEFVYNPPPSFTAVKTFAEVFGVGADTKSLVNKPAPNFNLSVRDNAGKLKTVSKSDFAGKVVVLIFWATWSPPSYSQLAVAQNLVDQKKDPRLAVVAVNVDDEPSASEQRLKKVLDAVKEKGLRFDEKSAFLLALDPVNSVGMAFHFQIASVPTTVVIDGQGVVRKSYSGYFKDTPEVLSRDVQELLKSPGR